MRRYLLINAVVEGLASMALLLQPGLLLYRDQASSEEFVLARLYGIAALLIATLSFQLYKHYQEGPLTKMCVLLIGLFHMAVAFHLNGVYALGLTSHIGAVVTHGLLAAGALLAYMNTKDS